MQPYIFTPWAWRDPAWFDDQSAAMQASESEETDAARRGRASLEGFRVEAIDGSIGSVDEASHDVDAAHIVVDTGPWIFGRKVLLPAGTIERVDQTEGRIYVDRTKEQIKDSPEYDPDTFSKPDYRTQVGSYYEQSYRDYPPSM